MNDASMSLVLPHGVLTPHVVDPPEGALRKVPLLHVSGNIPNQP